MNSEDLLTQLLYTAVPVWAERPTGDRTLSTGFIATVPTDPAGAETIPFVVVNNHAVKDATRVIVEFFERENDRPSSRRIRVEVAGDTNKLTDPLTEITAIPVAAVFARMDAARRYPFFRSISPDLVPSPSIMQRFSAVEELVSFGFSEAFSASSDSLPLARRGISATPLWRNIDGHPAFLLDASVLPGFAGGPVFHYTKEDVWSMAPSPARAYFVGAIAGAAIASPTSDQAGLTVVTKSDALFVFLTEIASRLVKPSA